MRSALPTLYRRLPAVNWLLLLASFGWTCARQRDLFWWLHVDWAEAIAALGMLGELRPLPAGSLWLVWLLLGIAWSVHARLAVSATPAMPAAAPAAPSADRARRQLAGGSDWLQARPELKEKLLRLHQSLDKL